MGLQSQTRLSDFHFHFTSISIHFSSIFTSKVCLYPKFWLNYYFVFIFLYLVKHCLFCFPVEGLVFLGIKDHFFFIPLVYVVYLSPIYSQPHLQSCKLSLNVIKHIRRPFLFNNFIYVFTFGCAGSWLLCWLFPSGGEWRLLSRCGVRASPWDSFSGCRAWAPGCLGFSSWGTLA